MKLKIIVGAGLLVIATSALAAPGTITGPARVIDGDTIEIQDQRIRLHGIDAPERSQTCLLEGRRYTLHDMEWIIGLIDAQAPKPGPRGAYKKRAN